MTIKEILGTCGTIDGAGRLTVQLSEGTFTFKDAIVLNRPDITFRGRGRATIFERTEDNGARAYLFDLTARGIELDGIFFNDVGDNDYAAVQISGDRCVVRNCIFGDCYRAVQVSGASGARVENNYVEEARDSSYAILIENAATDGIVSGNIIEESGLTEDIYFNDATLRFAIVGNQTFNGRISYRGADGHAAAGNPGTVTVR
jgi:nitrous oxidase accessory protein NosD